MIGTGDNREVARHAQMVLDAPVHSTKLNVAVFGSLHRAARPILARNLWVLGYPDQAVVVGAQVRGSERPQAALAALHEDGYELYRPCFSLQVCSWLRVLRKQGSANSHPARSARL